MGNLLIIKKTKYLTDVAGFIEYINEKNKYLQINKKTTNIVNNLQSIIQDEVNAELWITATNEYKANPYNNIIIIPMESIVKNTVNSGALYHEIGHFKYYKRGLKLTAINSCVMIACNLISASVGLIWPMLPISIGYGISLYLIDQYIEKKCDLYACERGYKKELKKFFEDAISSDIIQKNDSWYYWLRISEKGNDRFDFAHPSSTIRLKYITEFNKQV